MFKVYRNGDNTQSSVVEIAADSRNDISELSTEYGVGSACIITEDSSVWMLGPDKEWHEI